MYFSLSCFSLVVFFRASEYISSVYSDAEQANGSKCQVMRFYVFINQVEVWIAGRGFINANQYSIQNVNSYITPNGFVVFHSYGSFMEIWEYTIYNGLNSDRMNCRNLKSVLKF